MKYKLRMVGVGPQRSGTTWLDECLRHHPELCLPSGVKETFFFDLRFDRGWDWYWSHFSGADERHPVEVAATYFDVPETAERIYGHNPECLILITLRDPAARSHSLYLHHRAKGRLDCDFSEGVRRMPRILDSSRYSTHVRRWMDTFGPQKVHIMLLDDIASDPNGALRALYAFAGLAEIDSLSAAHRRINPGGIPASQQLARWAWRVGHWLRDHRLYGPVGLAKKLGLKRVYGSDRTLLPPLPAEERAELIRVFDEDIAYVEELLRRPLPQWRRIQETNLPLLSP